MQVGDLLDRGLDEVKIFDTVERLVDEADEAGGGLHLLLGNHELMAMQGQDDYYLEGPQPWKPSRYSHFCCVTGDKARVMADKFAPAVIIGESLFVHGGVSATMLDNLERIFIETKHALGQTGTLSREVSRDLDTILWCRRWHKDLPNARQQERAVKELRGMLARHGLKRFVCGHSPREEVELDTTFDGLVYNCDLPLNEQMQKMWLEDRAATSSTFDVKVQVLDLGSHPAAEPQFLTGFRESDPRLCT